MYRDLREFIDTLDKKGQLRHIHAPVNPELEISEINDRIVKENGPALLFHNVAGYKIPVLINTFGSKERMLLGLGLDSYETFFDKYFELLEKPTGLMDKLKLLPRLTEIAQMMPKTVKTGPCKEVILRDPSLDILPILKCWPSDAGRYITLPLVFTVDPKTGKHNCGCYRLQVVDNKTLIMHWQLHKHGALHHKKHMGEKKKMDVAIALGCDPALTFSAIAPLPDDLYEMLFAGLLREKAVEMVQCETVDLEVPANAEIVLEGYVDPSEELRVEGPFGDHTGYYSQEDKYPAFHLTCVTHRKEPIYQTIIVGPPPQEDDYLGQAVERLFLPIIRKQLPEIVDMHMPFEGIFHNLMIVAIRKSYPGHARKIMNAIWSLGQAMFTKVVVIVDHDVDIHDYSEVVWKALCAMDPERDVQFSFGPMDTLDHAARMQDYGSKMGLDATRKWPSEGFTRPWPDEILMDETTKKRVAGLWKSLGL